MFHSEKSNIVWGNTLLKPTRANNYPAKKREQFITTQYNSYINQAAQLGSDTD